jgi:hypothetical protein
MAFDGFGNFTRLHNWAADKLAAIKITAVRHDEEDDGFATAFNQVVLRNGVAPMTGDLKLGNNKITGIGAGTNLIPSLAYSADPTTGMFFPAAGVVAWSAAGVERIRAHNTGVSVQTGQLFGIGTNTPRTQLDVIGISSFQGAFEDTVISASALTGVVNIDYVTSAIVMYTANAVGNWTFNIRADAGNTLNSIMQIGQTMTCAIEVPQGVTPYYCTTITVDGAAPAATKWSGGGAPTAGNASGIDTYLIRVTKTANATFQVRASLTQEK